MICLDPNRRRVQRHRSDYLRRSTSVYENHRRRALGHVEKEQIRSVRHVLVVAAHLTVRVRRGREHLLVGILVN